MIYEQLYVSMHIYKKQRNGRCFPFNLYFSKTTHVDNTLCKSINLLKCVCHASLSFIDLFNNPIIKLMCYVLKKLICLTPVAETPLCLLIFRSDNTLLKSDYRK